MAPRKKSPSRTAHPPPYYFIVEGCTEENYIQCLKNTFNSRKVAKPKNCNGGSAKNVLLKANKIIGKYKEFYSGFVIWFDKDKDCSSTDKEEANLKNRLIQQDNVEIFISAPCIEHWLLAHFQTINLAEHQTCEHYENKLKQYIKNYNKNDYYQLKQYLDSEKVNTAIQNYPEIGKICQNYF